MAGIFGAGDFNRAGSGISKSAAPKGSLKLFFEILGVRIWKLLALNLIYVIACLPIITIGPATAGITKVLKNYSIDKNAYVWLDFKEAFLQNFSKAFFVGLVDIVAYLGIASGLYIYPNIVDYGGSKVIYYGLYIVTLSVAVTFTIMNYYIYLMLVSTDLPMKSIVKNALALAFLSPKRNLIALLSNVLLPLIPFLFIVFLNFQFIIILPFAPATIIGFIVCFCCYPVVQKYVTDPYYKATGEQNPERPEAPDAEEVLFEDMGGKEKPVELKKKKGKGKIIS